MMTYAKQESNQQFLHTMHKQGNMSVQIKNKTVSEAQAKVAQTTSKLKNVSAEYLLWLHKHL